MKKVSFLLAFIFWVVFAEAQTNVLVFSKTNGYRHASIEAGQQMFKTMAKKNNWRVTFSEDSLIFNPKLLSATEVVVLLNTSGNIFGPAQKEALQKYIRKGGGLVAIHGAIATEKESAWYAAMVGAAFKYHPKPQKALVNIINHDFKAMQHFGESWLYFDEWYNYTSPVNNNCVVLARVDESSYKGGKMGKDHPVIWYQNLKKGRVFTSALGHAEESYTNDDFVKMVKEAVIWAGGK